MDLGPDGFERRFHGRSPRGCPSSRPTTTRIRLNFERKLSFVPSRHVVVLNFEPWRRANFFTDIGLPSSPLMPTRRTKVLLLTSRAYCRPRSVNFSRNAPVFPYPQSPNTTPRGKSASIADSTMSRASLHFGNIQHRRECGPPDIGLGRPPTTGECRVESRQASRLGRLPPLS